MKRITGRYKETRAGDELVKAFVPRPLPPKGPSLQLKGKISDQLNSAVSALKQLSVAGSMVPNPGWYLYGFVRKEAVISSQIEGTQATLEDVVRFEATDVAERPADVEEVCNYIAALMYARKELAKSKGLPISVRLFCEIHKRLMEGVRGADKQPGEIRRSQNWIGGSRPGNAAFVPPPPGYVGKTLSDLEEWIHSDSKLHPLIKAGLAHVQFETIHPFLDGNGRIGRLLIVLLLEYWNMLDSPLLYVSLAFKRQRRQYYNMLSKVRTNGDWESWVSFFLNAVVEAAQDGVASAGRLFAVVSRDRQVLLDYKTVTISAMKLFEVLPDHPIITLASALKLSDASKPTIVKAIKTLVSAGILVEISGKRRDRVYAYKAYLDVLGEDTEN